MRRRNGRSSRVMTAQVFRTKFASHQLTRHRRRHGHRHGLAEAMRRDRFAPIVAALPCADCALVAASAAAIDARALEPSGVRGSGRVVTRHSIQTASLRDPTHRGHDVPRHQVLAMAKRLLLLPPADVRSNNGAARARATSLVAFVCDRGAIGAVVDDEATSARERSACVRAPLVVELAPLVVDLLPARAPALLAAAAAAGAVGSTLRVLVAALLERSDDDDDDARPREMARAVLALALGPDGRGDDAAGAPSAAPAAAVRLSPRARRTLARAALVPLRAADPTLAELVPLGRVAALLAAAVAGDDDHSSAPAELDIDEVALVAAACVGRRVRAKRSGRSGWHAARVSSLRGAPSFAHRVVYERDGQSATVERADVRPRSAAGAVSDRGESDKGADDATGEDDAAVVAAEEAARAARELEWARLLLLRAANGGGGCGDRDAAAAASSPRPRRLPVSVRRRRRRRSERPRRARLSEPRMEQKVPVVITPLV